MISRYVTRGANTGQVLPACRQSAREGNPHIPLLACSHPPTGNPQLRETGDAAFPSLARLLRQRCFWDLIRVWRLAAGDYKLPYTTRVICIQDRLDSSPDRQLPSLFWIDGTESPSSAVTRREQDEAIDDNVPIFLRCTMGGAPGVGCPVDVRSHACWVQ